MEWEWGSRGRGYVYIYVQLTHFVLQPKLTHHCKPIILGEKKKNSRLLLLELIISVSLLSRLPYCPPLFYDGSFSMSLDIFPTGFHYLNPLRTHEIHNKHPLPARYLALFSVPVPCQPPTSLGSFPATVKKGWLGATPCAT